MPKSRRRKNRKSERVTKEQVVRRTKEILAAQRQRFREIFGRDWGPGDPVFFDDSADTPTKMAQVEIQAEVLEAMRKAGTPPQIVYAYKRTGGLLLTEAMREHWPPERVREWDVAIDEFFAIEAASKRPDRPDPEAWKTEIPELLVSPFTKQDLEQVHECIRAVEPIEARGIKVVTRIELAAAFLASALEHGFDSGAVTAGRGEGPELFALTERLVVQRAREIYAQGRA